MNWKNFKQWLKKDYKYVLEVESKGIWHIKHKHAHHINTFVIGLLLGVIASRIWFFLK